MENNTISVRHRAEGDLGTMTYEEFEAMFQNVVDQKLKK
jgi:threonyl-tRNA synthetase